MNIKKMFYYVGGYVQQLKYKIIGFPKMKQELLVRLALKEKGFNLRKIKISIDHDLGLNYINGVKLGVKYPDSFFEKATELGNSKKFVNYYFNGNMSDSGGRKKMLEPFAKMPNSVIVESNDGRIEEKKDKFNNEYFQGLANAMFGLCPHQADWQGTQDALWTYRFIECCFVKTIPVLFKEAPLSIKFTEGFNKLWAHEILSSDEIKAYNGKHAEENNKLAKQRFCLTSEECKQIQNTLNKAY